MADIRIMKIAAIDHQTGDTVDVEIMRLAVTEAVKRKLAVVDLDAADNIRRGEQSILIVVEITVVEDKVAAFVADAGAIAVDHSGSGKRKIVDCDIAVGDENGFTVGNQAG